MVAEGPAKFFVIYNIQNKNTLFAQITKVLY